MMRKLEYTNRFKYKVVEVKNQLNFGNNRQAAQNFINRNKHKNFIIVRK